MFWGGRGGGGGGCRVGGGGGIRLGGQDGCEQRSKIFVKIQKKTFFEGGLVGVGGGGPIRGWGGGGWGSKVLVRWVMWGMGDVNQELKALINVLYNIRNN